MVSLTIFDSIYDNKTVKRIDYKSFDDFEKVLYRLADGDKYQKKTDAPLISPATYKTETTRANANVVSWGGFGIVDVDDYEGSIEDIHEKYSKYKYVCYSTASSTKEHPKFRLVFPLTESVDADRIKHFWFALNKEIGDIADAQTKDLSRMYYAVTSVIFDATHGRQISASVSFNATHASWTGASVTSDATHVC